eukprot:GHVN01066682.1.p1 GENE.GHVN01066682.1~~GHVN01066682.1.p1  ORF type:complete len:105 (+),score=23.06 GHVN01066682.1:272-586(+)
MGTSHTLASLLSPPCSHSPLTVPIPFLDEDDEVSSLISWVVLSSRWGDMRGVRISTFFLGLSSISPFSPFFNVDFSRDMGSPNTLSSSSSSFDVERALIERYVE